MRDKIVRKVNSSDMATLEYVLWHSSETPVLASAFGYRVYKMNGREVVLFKQALGEEVQYLGTVKDGNPQSGAVDIMLRHMLVGLANPNLHLLMEGWADESTIGSYKKLMQEAGLHTRVAIEFIKEYTEGGN